MAEWAQNMRLLDRLHIREALDPLHAFAIDELLCRRTGRGGQALCHLWRHPRAFILGARDAKLPYADKAIKRLEADGWSVAVRNSGGAAVPLDEGVVNLSLIVPNVGMRQGSYRDDFEKMYRLVGEALQGTGRRVDKGIVPGAYCPGDYDLAIDGRKFCGVSQRRQVQATVIQAFIVAEGSGEARAQLVRNFYDTASGGDDSLGQPLVDTEAMASLEQLTELRAPVADVFADGVRQTLAGLSRSGALQVYEGTVLPEQTEIAAMIAILRNRYGHIKSESALTET